MILIFHLSNYESLKLFWNDKMSDNLYKFDWFTIHYDVVLAVNKWMKNRAQVVECNSTFCIE